MRPADAIAKGWLVGILASSVYCFAIRDYGAGAALLALAAAWAYISR